MRVLRTRQEYAWLFSGAIFLPSRKKKASRQPAASLRHFRHQPRLTQRLDHACDQDLHGCNTTGNQVWSGSTCILGASESTSWIWLQVCTLCDEEFSSTISACRQPSMLDYSQPSTYVSLQPASQYVVLAWAHELLVLRLLHAWCTDWFWGNKWYQFQSSDISGPIMVPRSCLELQKYFLFSFFFCGDVYASLSKWIYL